MWRFIRKPLSVDLIFTVSSRTLRYFSRRPSPFCSSTISMRPWLLNFNLLEVVSQQQQVLLPKHSVSEHLNSSLNRPGYLLSCFFCASRNKFEGRIYLIHSPQKCHCSQQIAYSPFLFSSLLEYNRSNTVQRESVSISNSSSLLMSQNLSQEL